MSTPILPFAVWEPGNNQNSIPANDNSLRNQILNGLVIGVEDDAPGGESDGDIYIVGDTPAGAFAGFDEFDLTIYMGGTWYAFAPSEGIVVNVAGALKRWDGAAYADVGGGGAVDSVNGQTGAVVLDAADIDYDNSGSGLSATDVQAAIDEIAAGGGGGGSSDACRWNPQNSSSTSRAAIIANAGLSLLDTVGGIGGHNKATVAKDSGKRYFEVTVDAMGLSGTPNIGVVQVNATGQVGDGGSVSLTRNASWGVLAHSGDKYHGSVNSYGTALSVGNVVSVAVDFGTGKIWWGKNGAWFASGDPAAGTNEAFSNLANWLYPAVSASNGAKVTANFGASAFAHTPPSGFVAWDS